MRSTSLLTSASTDETVGEQPLATSQIVLSTSCGIDAGQGFILAPHT
ncbi:MAG TPA: hypothetical protein VI894_04010 [Candidatus Nanoarchaeia archaeon]|nr:hypothetical protein [Candidatus Nanoarchaeia archaeon]